MISWDILRPPSGSHPVAQVNLVNVLVQPPMLRVKTIQFTKDIGEAKGTGTATLWYDPTVWLGIKENSKYIVSLGYEKDDVIDIKEYMSGNFKNPQINGSEIQINLEDMGSKLEGEGTLTTNTPTLRSFLMRTVIVLAGLNPDIKFGSVKDDKLFYNSTASTGSDSTSSGDCVCLSGQPSTKCPGSPAWGTTGQKCWSKTCPNCGRATLMPSWKPGFSNQITCGTKAQQKAGSACGDDFCVQSGYVLDRSCSKKMKPCSGSSSASASASGDGGSTPSTDVAGSGSSSGGSSSSSKTWWDMLMELLKPVDSQLECFVWMDTCYIQPIPPLESATLQIDGDKNVLFETPTITEGVSTLVNTVNVQYGKGKLLQTATAQNVELADKYGVNETNVTKTKLNATEAQAYADSTLAIGLRDSGFSIEVELLGSNEWYIGRVVKFIHSKYDADGWYFISRVEQNYQAGQVWYSDVTLVPYYPTPKTASSSTSANLKTDMAGVNATIARFKSIPYDGCDCWCMSDYLFNALSGAGYKVKIVQYPTSLSARHRSVLVDLGHGWENIDYTGFALKFHNTSSSLTAPTYKESG